MVCLWIGFRENLIFQENRFYLTKKDFSFHFEVFRFENEYQYQRIH
jgi:hypothetical protein